MTEYNKDLLKKIEVIQGDDYVEDTETPKDKELKENRKKLSGEVYDQIYHSVFACEDWFDFYAYLLRSLVDVYKDSEEEDSVETSLNKLIEGESDLLGIAVTITYVQAKLLYPESSFLTFRKQFMETLDLFADLVSNSFNTDSGYVLLKPEEEQA